MKDKFKRGEQTKKVEERLKKKKREEKLKMSSDLCHERRRKIRKRGCDL